LRSDTHFEQIPLETIKALVPEEPREEEKAEQVEASKEEDFQNPRRRKVQQMESPFDIFRTETDGQMIWRGAAASLEEANARVREFAKSSPGDYMIVNLRSGLRIRIAASGANSPEEETSQASFAPD